MRSRILFLQGVYPEFLGELYAAEPELACRCHDDQLRRLLDTGFGHSDAYSEGVRRFGAEAADVFVDADLLQAQWAREHGLLLPENTHERRRRIVEAQIHHFRPDILYVFEWSPLGDAFLAAMKGSVRWVVGQVASPLAAHRTYAAYDLMISSFPPLVDFFRRGGKRAETIKLGFDERVLAHVDRGEVGIGVPSREPRYDVTFLGGFAPSHTDRIHWLERVLRDVPVDIFGYGLERVPGDSILHEHFRGPAWGWDMYRVLRESRITLNLHARIEAGGEALGPSANNMRLFESTGMGTCLLTDAKPNLAELFDLECEVLTFQDADECVAKIRRHLADETARRAVADAGQARTLRDHTYRQRMEELLDVLGRCL